MEHAIKHLLEHMHNKELRELITHHVHDIHHDESANEITLLLDKQYTINELKSSSDMIEALIAGIEECYGEHKKIALRIDTPHHGHDREMNIPHYIHR